jgi:hypothetical protein
MLTSLLSLNKNKAVSQTSVDRRKITESTVKVLSGEF